MGYLSDEQSTKRAFDEEMWFRTSDMGKFDENGMLTLFGRLNGDNKNWLIIMIFKTNNIE